MPRLRTESFGGGDLSWLSSTHGLRNAKTGTVNVSAFTAGTHFPNGYIPSGTPVSKVSGLLVPYTVAEGTTTGAGVLEGFLLTDQPCATGGANFAAPVLDHGRVIAAKVPYASFVEPAAAAKRARTSFIYE